MNVSVGCKGIFDFAIGSMKASQRNENTETISIDCHINTTPLTFDSLELWIVTERMIVNTSSRNEFPP